MPKPWTRSPKLHPREFKDMFRAYRWFDTVSNLEIEIKCTPKPNGNHYDIGTHIPLDNGLYIGSNGWFVVYNEKVLIAGNKVYDKWGGQRCCNDFIHNTNPIAHHVLDVEYILDDDRLEELA